MRVTVEALSGVVWASDELQRLLNHPQNAKRSGATLERLKGMSDEEYGLVITAICNLESHVRCLRLAELDLTPYH